MTWAIVALVIVLAAGMAFGAGCIFGAAKLAVPEWKPELVVLGIIMVGISYIMLIGLLIHYSP